ncbi:DUF1330 domain-containing protein [Nocardioides houyundeii]|uniref:DUF1330 domain-containing protein n=1 Tax=Nocardioides houyundeii TaxID=2045452 RepID=UPI000DF1520E|nr:DUF1330 domain-containing protein [Nocardioides houyundeii]
MVDPTPHDLQQFLDEAPDRPFVMLNLLRYAEGGRELYTDYLRRAESFVEAAGARVLFFGKGLPALVPDRERSWDAVMLVWYPSPAAFCAMAEDEAYAEVAQLRSRALSEAVLQPTTVIAVDRPD